MTYSKIPLQLGIEDGCKHILEKDKNCVVVLADMGLCIFSEEFMDYYADRIFQIGIAEQNAIAICGGMAAAGLHPIFITFASFLVRRGLDQIINSVLVPKFPVILIGIRSGLSEAGGISHCIVNDIGILKALPNIEIYEASSFVQLKNILFLVYSKNAPAYIRVSDEFNNNYSILGDYAVRSKGSEIIKEGLDGVILTYGKMVSRALKVRKIFLKEKISLGVVNLYSIYPLDESSIINILNSYNKIFVVEEHFCRTGVLEDIKEIRDENHIKVEVISISIKNKCIHSGKVNEILKKEGLDFGNIYDIIKKNI